MCILGGCVCVYTLQDQCDYLVKAVAVVAVFNVVSGITMCEHDCVSVLKYILSHVEHVGMAVSVATWSRLVSPQKSNRTCSDSSLKSNH